MAQGIEDKNPNDWRNTWIVESLIAPLPVVGPFFKMTDYRHAFYHSGKQATMLAGGTAVMLMNLAGDKMDDPLAERYAKSIANMALGMASAAVFYDAAIATAKRCCQRETKPDSERLLDDSPPA